jgi:succinate dehydrogenase assembly factor 1
VQNYSTPNDGQDVFDVVQNDETHFGSGNWFDRQPISQILTTTMSIRRSGLQREVLAFYRRSVPTPKCLILFSHLQKITLNSALRMVFTKPPLTQPKFLLFVRYTFRHQASSVSARDVAAVEHLLRKGRRQLEGLEERGVRDCWVSKEMEEWDGQQRTGLDVNVLRRKFAQQTIMDQRD